MTVGTKSLLYGCHQIFIHPLIVAMCYIKLYGCPLDFKIWLSIIIHDWGYWGKKNMDGDCFVLGGAWHPYFAATTFAMFGFVKAGRFCLYHSRFVVNRLTYNRPDIYQPTISRLGIADKLAIIYTPIWMYQKDELKEYMSKEGYQYGKETKKLWKAEVDAKCKLFVEEWKEKAYDINEY